MLTPCPTCLTPIAASASCCPTCCLARRAGSKPRVHPAALALLGLTLAACGDKDDTGGEPEPQPDYGVAFVADGDEDALNPDATETPGDGVDSNCDGSDDN
jgi:hypothetical protein